MPEQTPTTTARVRLRRGADRRLRHGHLWVYSNEVIHPDDRPAAGSLVHIEDNRGRFVASAAYHPGALIAGRIWSRDPKEAIDERLVRSRLAAAMQRRRAVIPGWPAYRLAHAEADGLPGLVVDRYGSLAVVQSTSVFTDSMLGAVTQALVEEHGCTAVLARNDARGRELEGLPSKVEVLAGEVPERWTVEEGGVPVRFDPQGGQKTGLFLDMRDCRDRMVSWAEGQRLLELYAYVGIASVRAAAAGARQVACVESSAPACELARENAAESGVADRVEVIQGDARAFVRDTAPGSWDRVICDPPSLIRRRKDSRRGLEAYRRIFYLALRAVKPGGLLQVASCSHLFSLEQLAETVATAASRQGRVLRRLHSGGASPDHPVLTAHPQSEYLKSQIYLVEGEPGGGREG